MAKRKKRQEAPSPPVQPAQTHMPVPTRRAFLVCLGTIAVALVAQFVIAVIGYQHIPQEIPSGWIGWAQPGGTLPSWLVFVAFPGAQLVVLILALFTPKDEQGRRVMEPGRAASLIVLTVLFTLLQASVFTIPR
jgi:hypothetical protein